MPPTERDFREGECPRLVSVNVGSGVLFSGVVSEIQRAHVGPTARAPGKSAGEGQNPSEANDANLVRRTVTNE